MSHMSRTPYKYLDYYTFEDADLFYGREKEVQKMVGEILSTRLLVLFSPSGSGKTSLINAGVRPALEQLGYKTIYVRLENDPIPSVIDKVSEELRLPQHNERQNLYEFMVSAVNRQGFEIQGEEERKSKGAKPLVIFLDQFEEFFTVFRNDSKLRKTFIEQLARIRYDEQLPVGIVLSLREDYFANLHEFRKAIPSIFQNNANIHLEPFSDEEARRAIEKPAKEVGLSYEDGLVNFIISDLKQQNHGMEGIEPIMLQMVCHTLWQRKDANSDRITWAQYKGCGGAQNIIENNVFDALGQIPSRYHGLMARTFEVLKTPENTKRFLSLPDMQGLLHAKKNRHFAVLLQELKKLNILRHETRKGLDWYEFKHDYLVDRINHWLNNREKMIMKRRLQYAIIPGIMLGVFLLAWAVYWYTLIEARFTDRVYKEQEQEIIIGRKFNPFHFHVTTDIDYNDIKDLDYQNRIKNGFVISTWNKNNWYNLCALLKKDISGVFLYKIGFIDEGRKALVGALRDQYSDVRQRVADALGRLGRADEAVVNALVDALTDQDADVRRQAADALGRLGKADEAVVNALVDALTDINADVRRQAADGLVRLGKADEAVIKVLVDALTDQDADVRRQAADTLVRLGKADEVVVKVLVDALTDQDADVRRQAADALVRLGKADEAVIKVLVDALTDINADVRRKAANALVRLVKALDAVVKAEVDTLTDQEADVSLDVAALLRLGKADEAVVKVLVKALVGALTDQDADTRRQAAVALGRLGKADEAVIKALVEALRDQDSYVRKSAADALGMILILQSKTDKELLKMLTDNMSGYRTAAMHAVKQRVTISEELENRVKELRDDKRPWVRLSAWDTYEVIRERREKDRLAEDNRKAGNRSVKKADALFRSRQFSRARNEYLHALESFEGLEGKHAKDVAAIQFKLARCETRLKRTSPAIEGLEKALEYDPSLRDTLRTEMAKPDSVWGVLKDNWYVNEVLLKKQGK